MANWQVVHKQDLESGEIYYQEASEVTLPRGYRVVWLTFWETIRERHKHRRPEMKIKDTNEPEPKVFSGNFSGVGFHVYSKFKWWMVSSPIDVTPGLVTRAKAQVMIISHGIEGDHNRPGACGMRVGIVDADAITLLDDDPSLDRAGAEELALTPPPDWDEQKAQNEKLSKWDVQSWQVTPQIIEAEDDIAWSLWWVVRGSLANEDVWKALQSDQPPPEDGPQPPFRPKGSQVRLILQCNADEAAAISAGHYDELIVEQDLDSGVEPPPPPPPLNNQERLIESALALQEQARVMLEMASGSSGSERARLIEGALVLQDQAKILLEMAK